MKNILVAEDDRSLRDGLVQAMSRGGYKVQTAQSGKEAMEKIEKQIFDLVIAGQKIGGPTGSKSSASASEQRRHRGDHDRLGRSRGGRGDARGRLRLRAQAVSTSRRSR